MCAARLGDPRLGAESRAGGLARAAETRGCSWTVKATFQLRNAPSEDRTTEGCRGCISAGSQDVVKRVVSARPRESATELKITPHGAVQIVRSMELGVYVVRRPDLSDRFRPVQVAMAEGAAARSGVAKPVAAPTVLTKRRQ